MNSETENLLLEQKLALKEFELKKKVICLPFNANATSFTLSTGRLIKFKGLEPPYKRTLFKALCFMNYSIQNPVNTNFKYLKFFSTIVSALMVFINTLTLNERSQAKVLKKFESYRVDNGCKPQSSGLRELKTLILKCLEENDFIGELNHSEIQYLITLSKTKLAPKVDIESITLTKWFTQYSWLRRDDIGIGNALYERLASPKALIGSFEITIGISMLAIQKIKYALIQFFQMNIIDLKGLSEIKKESHKRLSVDQIKNNKRILAASVLELIRKIYYQVDNKSAELKAAMVCILHSVTVNTYFKQMNQLHFIVDNDEQSYLITHKKIPTNFFTSQHSELFSPDFLIKLFKYAEKKETAICPITGIEKKLFQWLMSTLKVQPSDIPKLKFDDFKFLKRVNGNITHIECEYFKGRSRGYHVSSSLPTNQPKGEALLNFITDATGNRKSTNTFLCAVTHTRSFAEKGKNAKMISILNIQYINNLISEEHRNKKVASLFLPALEKLFSNISLINNSELKNVSNHATSLFSFTAIKNTAVYAESDKFDPTQLLNYNSHTNETERSSYLTEANQEWKNNCGRITRAVMNDIEVNLYRPSLQFEQIFESEFIKAVDFIKLKKIESLARLKIVTNKESGSVNDLGICLKPKKTEYDLPDDIYLIDSPETVMKLKHYLSEAEKNHKALVRKAPEFTFNTLLPTVEWIEEIFQESKFSSHALIKGQEMFEVYGAILPPIFKAQGV